MLCKIIHCEKCGNDYLSCCTDECPHPRWVDTKEAEELFNPKPRDKD